MSVMEVRIHEKIFKDYPTFRRGIVLARSMENHGHSDRLGGILSQAVSEAGHRPVDLKSDPRILVWNDAHRAFGSNPNKFPPAHCALLKRIQKPGAQIPFINKVVAVMNTNSITDVMPVGGDDLAGTGQCLELRHAAGNESFTPLGSPEIAEHPAPGEIIYVVAESGDVMCRRWNWRNGHRTRITEETRGIVMNIDGLGEESEARTIVARDRVAEMLREFCQADVVTMLLTPSHPSYQFEN